VSDLNSGAATRLHHWLRAFIPGKLIIDSAERWRSVLGAGLGILIAAAISRFFAAPDAIWLVAPLGASAVLVFAVPASPLAQPWAVVVGNTLSAAIGIACVRFIGDPALAGCIAVALAIAAMMATRSLHPPGGAMALFAVLGHSTDFGFALFPALTNSLLLVLAGIGYNTVTNRRYPHVQLPQRAHPDQPASRFKSSDLDAVLARYNQILDVSRDDLENIVQLTQMHALRRQLGEIRCGDIMSRDLITAQYSTPLQETWTLMRRHRIKALPIVDRHMRVLGIVTLADFMRHANIETHGGMREKLYALLKQTTTVHTIKPEVAGQIMTSQVRVASADRHIIDLVPIFSNDGHHHIPIIDAERRLVGIITESDFVRALYGTVDPQEQVVEALRTRSTPSPAGA
jgi:CBS domain-containing membrane protein